jgi:hypothetical protein
MPQLAQTILTSTANVLDKTGEKSQADGYYGHSDGLHTVSWTFNNFKGRIKLQGTLATDPQPADWVDLDLDGSGTGYVEHATAKTGTDIYNVTGNFVWVRAQVIRSYDPTLTVNNAGVVTKVLFNY